MEQDFDIDRAAAGLAAAWHGGVQPAGLRPLVRPRTLAEGYDTQDRLVALLGYPVIGWKIGLASRSGYRAAGLERPIFGRVLKPRCFVNADIVAVLRDTLVTVELELALVIGRDVGAQTEANAALIHSAHLGFEIVSSRLPDRQTIGIAATIADNAVSHAVVLGDEVDFVDCTGIAARALVTVDGNTASIGLNGDDLPDPLSVLGHLIAHLGERGQTLRRGDVVFTGTLTKPFNVAAPCELIGGGRDPAVRCRLQPSP